MPLVMEPKHLGTCLVDGEDKRGKFPEKFREKIPEFGKKIPEICRNRGNFQRNRTNKN